VTSLKQQNGVDVVQQTRLSQQQKFFCLSSKHKKEFLKKKKKQKLFSVLVGVKLCNKKSFSALNCYHVAQYDILFCCL